MGWLQTVLLVEDDESDEFQAVRSIKRSGIDVEILVARNGEEASEMLADEKLNLSLVFLDIKLPKKNGFEVLSQIRRQAHTKLVPVVMLSSSSEPQDMERAAELGANSYLQKEIDAELSDNSIKLTLYYWLAVHARASDKVRLLAIA